jgi:epoxyqueuosine reductase
VRWQGKHSLLISKKFGTLLELGGIITNADLEHNTNEESDRCRNCDKCQKACPLAALDQPYVLNVKKCMSYLLQNDKIPENLKIGEILSICQIYVDCQKMDTHGFRSKFRRRYRG